VEEWAIIYFASEVKKYKCLFSITFQNKKETVQFPKLSLQFLKITSEELFIEH